MVNPPTNRKKYKCSYWVGGGLYVITLRKTNVCTHVYVGASIIYRKMYNTCMFSCPGYHDSNYFCLFLNFTKIPASCETFLVDRCGPYHISNTLFLYTTVYYCYDNVCDTRTDYFVLDSLIPWWRDDIFHGDLGSGHTFFAIKDEPL